MLQAFVGVVTLWFGRPLAGQFVDEFDGAELVGWSFLTGDGQATMEMVPGPGYASIRVDARNDRRNIWWALVKREVSGSLDLSRLAEPGYELRIQARIRVSHAPRRVNLHLNTQKTVDFHSHLMEFDIPDTTGWHDISMTTRGFDAEPGDIVNGQLALMDWGLGRYRVDLDAFRVQVVYAPAAGPDLGAQMPYRPPVPDPASFPLRLAPLEEAVIDLRHPEVNLRNWQVSDVSGTTPVLTVNPSLVTILRWDRGPTAGTTVQGVGLLELTTHSVHRAETSVEEFGLVRVVEIIGGTPDWRGESVTTDVLAGGRPLDEVINGQMIIDVPVEGRPGGKTYVTLSRPVLQRLIDGRSLGLALLPLGAVNASFHTSRSDGGAQGPRLLLDSR